MIRLIDGSGKNSPEEYDRIFQEKKPDWQDLRRWKKLLRYYRGGSLIDLGCLNSEIPKLMSYPNLYTGIDTARKSLIEMQKKYPHSCYEYASLYNLPSIIKIYPHSYAVLGEVLEHLEEPEKAVREAFRVLKSGGILAISVPLEEAIEPGAVDGERHLWSYTKQDILDLVAPYSKKVKTKVLRSRWFPYKYCWPQLICWATKR